MARKSKSKGERRRPPRSAAFSVKNSTTSPFQIELQKKRATALQLRMQYFTYEQIAEHMGEAMTTVYDWVREAMDAIPRDAAQSVLAMELRRLEELQGGVYGSAAEGDIPAIDANLRIMDRRARLLGLYPDPKHGDVAVSVGGVATNGHDKTTEIRVSFVRPGANGHDKDAEER